MEKILAAISFLFFAGIASISSATPVTFIYESTTNARMANGLEMEAVKLIYTFDSDVQSLLEEGTHRSYGPWQGTLHIGAHAIELTGGTVELFDNAGTTIKNDVYDIRWESSIGSSSGTVFGKELVFFRIAIINNDLLMLSSLALPTSPRFALKGDYIQDDYWLSSEDSTDLSQLMFGLSEFSGPVRSFTLSADSFPVPEPATMFLFGSGVLGLVALRRKLAK